MSRRKTLADVTALARPLCLGPDTPAAAASKAMMEHDTGAVAVTENGRLVGIVTERDIAFRLVAVGGDPRETPLRAIMTDRPDTLAGDADVREALDVMQANGYRHVPVTEQGRVIGIISVRDLFNEVRRDLLADIQVRHEYMFGSGYSVPAVLH